MLVVELAGRKSYLRVNGVRNKVMSNVIRKQASGIQKQGKQIYVGPNVSTDSYLLCACEQPHHLSQALDLEIQIMMPTSHVEAYASPL